MINQSFGRFDETGLKFNEEKLPAEPASSKEKELRQEIKPLLDELAELQGNRKEICKTIEDIFSIVFKDAPHTTIEDMKVSLERVAARLCAAWWRCEEEVSEQLINRMDRASFLKNVARQVGVEFQKIVNSLPEFNLSFLNVGYNYSGNIETFNPRNRCGILHIGAFIKTEGLPHHTIYEDDVVFFIPNTHGEPEYIAKAPKFTSEHERLPGSIPDDLIRLPETVRNTPHFHIFVEEICKEISGNSPVGSLLRGLSDYAIPSTDKKRILFYSRGFDSLHILAQMCREKLV